MRFNPDLELRKLRSETSLENRPVATAPIVDEETPYRIGHLLAPGLRQSPAPPHPFVPFAPGRGFVRGWPISNRQFRIGAPDRYCIRTNAAGPMVAGERRTADPPLAAATEVGISGYVLEYALPGHYARPRHAMQRK